MAASWASVAAAEGELEKLTRYGSPVSAISFETYGRLGATALKQLRRLARAQAARLDDEGQSAASALLQRWGCWLSVALQRALVLSGPSSRVRRRPRI